MVSAVVAVALPLVLEQSVFAAAAVLVSRLAHYLVPWLLYDQRRINFIHQIFSLIQIETNTAAIELNRGCQSGQIYLVAAVVVAAAAVLSYRRPDSTPSWRTRWSLCSGNP